jgi:hypothetical protein
MKRLYPPLALLFVAVLAYGLLLPRLGFYWDGLAMSWIRYQLGPEAMRRYFSTNRPVWGLLYQLTTRLLPDRPLAWQIFALFWRWVTGVLVWAIVRELWPRRNWLALAAGLLFLVYPGFNQQWVAFLYSHFFIVLAFFLFSFLCMLWSFRRRRWLPKAWPWTVSGMLFSALNLWMMEYFFVLELIRPLLIWIVVREQVSDVRARLRRAFSLWLPYLLVFVAAVLSRLFIFNNQIYGFGLLSSLKANPAGTLASLAKVIPVSLWTVSAAAWGQVFTLPDLTVAGPRTIAVYAAVIILAILVLLFYLLRSRLEAEEEGRPGQRRRDGLWAVGLGFFSLLAAGWPFWLIDFPPGLAFPLNRFTLPFMLGVSLILAGLLELIPLQSLRTGLLVLLVGLGVGRQFLWANDYRLDWNTQKDLFWQMSWRIPALAPDTLVLMNEGALNFYADNSLSAPLNWIYAPENHTEHIDYMLFYPTNRLGGGLPGVEKNLPVTHDFIAGVFNGNTSQTISLYFSPPGCLRLLDPEIDPENHLILDTSLMREAARLSSSVWILSEGTPRMPLIYTLEPPHGWCYYFEQADLARQQGDWQKVVELGDKAFKLDDHPNDPLERFVFVEGYAHVGDWERALQLSRDSYRVSPDYVAPLLCRLWERIDAETPQSSDKEAAMRRIGNEFGCHG